MNKLRKKQIKVAATAFIALAGGLTIWSCSQDELDDFGQPIYRYTAEEIATLNSLADEYGLKDVRFITESDTPLPPLKEMKDLFKELKLMVLGLVERIKKKQKQLSICSKKYLLVDETNNL